MLDLISKLQEELNLILHEKQLLQNDLKTMSLVSTNISHLLDSSESTLVSPSAYQELQQEVQELKKENKIYESIISDLEQHIQQQEVDFKQQKDYLIQQSDDTCNSLHNQLNNTLSLLLQQNENLTKVKAQEAPLPGNFK